MDARDLSAPQAYLLIDSEVEATIERFSDDAYSRFRSAKLFAEAAIGRLLKDVVALPAFAVFFDGIWLQVAFNRHVERFFIGGCFDFLGAPDWPNPPGGGMPVVIFADVTVTPAGFELRITDPGGRRILNAIEANVAEISHVRFVGDDFAGVYGLEVGEMVEFPGGIKGVMVSLECDNVGAVISWGGGAASGSDTVMHARTLFGVPISKGLVGCEVESTGNPVDGQGPRHFAERCSREVGMPSVIWRQFVGDYQIGKTALVVGTPAYEREPIDQGADGECALDCVSVVVVQKRVAAAAIIGMLEDCDGVEFSIDAVATASDPAFRRLLAHLTPCAIVDFFYDRHWNTQRPDATARELPWDPLVYVVELRGGRLSIVNLQYVSTALECDLENVLYKSLTGIDSGRRLGASAAAISLQRLRMMHVLAVSEASRHSAWLGERRGRAAFIRLDLSLGCLGSISVTVYFTAPAGLVLPSSMRCSIRLAASNFAIQPTHVPLFVDEFERSGSMYGSADSRKWSHNYDGSLRRFGQCVSRFSAIGPAWADQSSTAPDSREPMFMPGSSDVCGDAVRASREWVVQHW